MLAHNGQIIALGQVKHNGSLSGTGAPGSELGVTNYEGLATQEWVFAQHYASAAPSGDYATKQYVDNGDNGVKSWTTEQLEEYAKKSELPDLTPYLTTQAAQETYWPKSCSSDYYKKGETYNRNEIDEKTKAYSGRNGIKIENHIISVSADYALASDLQNYYTKQQTYSRDEIDARLNNLGGYEVVVNSDPVTHQPILPAGEEPSNKYIYLVKVDGATPDSYYEWIYQENENPQWQCIGTTSLDLTEYVTETELATTLQDYATNDYVSANYALKTEIPSDFYTKQEVNDIVEPFITSAEADNRYQLKGEYLTEADIAHLNAASAGWNETQQTVDQNKDKWNTVEDRMFTSAFNGWSANADIQPYVGANGIEVDGHTIKPSASWVETDALSAYYKKNETSGKEQLATEFEKYQLAGDYALKEDLDNYVPNSAASAWDVTKYTEGEGIKIVGHEISISADYVDPTELETALEPYMFTSAAPIVKSTNGSVDVSAYMEDGHIVYDLSASQGGGDYTQIVGENGISAAKNELTGEWHVGMDKENLVAYGKFHTSLNRNFTTNTSFSGYSKDDYLSEYIDLDDDVVVLKDAGLYHVDIQALVQVPGGENAYYTVTLKSNASPARSTMKEIDASYEHDEVIEFSYDIRTTAEETELDIGIENLPAGSNYQIIAMNVHRVISSLSEIEGVSPTYQAGDGIKFTGAGNDVIEVDYGKGLEIEGHQLQVKLGNGLRWSTSGSIDAIEINNEVEEVVQTVESLKQELDSKLTTNFNYPQISDVDTDFTSYQGGGNNTCVCQLFAVPLTHKIIADKTQLTVYIRDSGWPHNAMLGIFEYDFEGNNGTGTTNWICDTGPINLGKHATTDQLTFPVKHVNTAEGRDELRSDRAYYAAILFDHRNTGLFLANCADYGKTVNSNPTLNWRIANVNVNWNDPGANLSAATQWWQSGYNEIPTMHRFFMQIRNKID